MMLLSPLCPDLGAWPPMGYVESRLDRAALRRAEAATLRADRDARVYAFGGELVALRPAPQAGGMDDPLLTFAEAAPWCGEDAIFLGQEGAAPRFAVAFDPSRREAIEAAGFTVTDLRSIAAGGLVAADHLGPLATGKALFGWHGRHRFCSNCGTPTRIVDGGWRRDCAGCGAQHFPRTDPVAIMLVARGNQCLLGRQPHFAPGMWSCLAGFVEPGETVEDAVRRETMEEAGITVGRVTYQSCQPWPFPMQLMLGCLAEATSEAITMDVNELEAVRWFSLEETATLLARTHPEGLFAPAPAAIAHHLIRAFVAGARA
ncbi:NAD(+) diphosphatase [Xanthobacter agilis]|uniref:NAD(+) diphosphatase n=1 Tax=Xanthobacter agilis TaxID=47492 RepID=A0ABU0LFG6_XANAG|nr:NAD(+) diphosphatase [Xanthobacter agilis]MDQ0505876.1 NAD+ diphosphatase [Xanthobacter agilis]